MARVRRDDFARLSCLVQQSGRGSVLAGHSQTVCLLRAARLRHVQARHQRTLSDLALPAQRTTGEDLLDALQREEQRSSYHVVGGPSLVFHRYHEKGVTKLRQNEYGESAQSCRSIVGYDANAL